MSSSTKRIFGIFACLIAAYGFIFAHRTHDAVATGPTSQASTRPTSQAAAKPSTQGNAWWRDAVFYQIFVRSFLDSDGDGIGDLKGIVQKLDYLKTHRRTTSRPSRGGRRDLGVTALWLTPIFASPSYHGYDTTDYRKINPAYGSLQTFRRLLREAKKRGIRVILDLMVNHTSRKHPWFLRAAKAKSPNERRWYVWRKSDPGWTQPWGSGRVWHPLGGSFYYGIFWSGMPDLNLAHKPARDAMFGIARHWLKQGVDGLRLDAARHLFAEGPGALQNDRPATHRFWRDFRRQAKGAAKDALLVGEVWSSASVIQRYCKGDQFDLAFHFPLAKAIKLAVSAMEAKPLLKVLKHPLPTRCWATFLANHDQQRIMSQLAGDLAMMRAASFLLLTLPGTPFLYYGEEIGMPNGTKQRGDPAKRTPMAWDASARGSFSKARPWTPLAPHKKANVSAQRGKKGSLWQHYQRLIALRHRHKALRRGSLVPVVVKGEGSDAVIAFLRRTPGQTLLILKQLNDEAASGLTLHEPLLLQLQKARAKFLYRRGKVLLQRSLQGWRLSVGPGAAAVLALTP